VADPLTECDPCIEPVGGDRRHRPHATGLPCGYRLFKNCTRSLFSGASSPRPKQPS
jgi:hypothetical protein